MPTAIKLPTTRSGWYEKYSTAKLESHLSAAEYNLKNAEAKLIEQEKRATKAKLEQQIKSILDAGKLQLSYFHWGGARKLHSDEALIQANKLRAKISELALPYDCSYSSDEHKLIESSVNTYKQVILEIHNAIPIAMQRASTLNRQRVAARIRREASEKRKIDKAQAVKALAAAHTNNTRSLASRMKRGLKQQIVLLPDCPYCQGSFEYGSHADHIYPVCKGGLSTHKNMVYVCCACNARKSSLTLLQFINTFNLNARRIYECLDLLHKDY